MKKVISITLIIFIVLSCKKSTPSSVPASTTVVSSFSVDGATISNPSHSSFMNGANFGVIAYGANSNPEIQITFFGSVAPAYGTYQITAGTISYGQCQFILSDTLSNVQGNSPATTGYVNVVTSSTAPKNKVAFSNISVTGNGGHHIVSGTITY